MHHLRGATPHDEDAGYASLDWPIPLNHLSLSYTSRTTYVLDAIFCGRFGVLQHAVDS